MIFKKIEIKSSHEVPDDGKCILGITKDGRMYYFSPISEEEYLREELQKFLNDYLFEEEKGNLNNIVNEYLKTRKV